MVLMVDIKTLKHYENLLKASSETKQYVKNKTITIATFPNENCNEIMKIKNNVVRKTYRQISLKNTS